MRPAFVLLLGALTMLPPLSIDVSLPGLPAIASALGASGTLIGQTLSLFIFGFGAGQLICGPLSDRFGRRPVLLAGLALFILAGVICSLASEPHVLLLARFLQGLGGSAGTVSSRAIVRDIASDRARAAALQSYVSAVNGIAPIVAPLLGVLILATLGWRSLYWILVLFGLALMAAAAAWLPETAPRNNAKHDTFKAYANVLSTPRMKSLALVIGCCFGAYFALISGSPFVLVSQLHLSQALFAIAFAINAASILVGSFSSAQLVRHFPSENIFACGIALLVFAGAAAGWIDVLHPNAIGFVATMSLFAFAFGIVFPHAYAAGLQDAGGNAGVASAVLGAAQMLGGAICGGLAGALTPIPSASVGITVVSGAIATTGFYLLSRRKRILTGTSPP